MIVHWDDVPGRRVDLPPLGLDRQDLGTAAGTRDVGLTRARVDPSRQSSPVHAELAEEEIFYVLAGTGLLWQGGNVYEVGAGSCIVHRVAEEAHTLIGGADGLDVLAFGQRSDATATFLPRARVLRAGATLDVSDGPHPFEREAAAGELQLPEPSPRPANVVHVDDVEDDDGWRDLGRAAGSVRTGISRVTVPPGQLHAPPHCHSAEEELFVVLEGDGTLELTPSPTLLDHGVQPESHAVRAGHVVSRPAGTRISHAFRAGERGVTMLAYGERRSNDITYYPRSNKINFRGVGVIARLEHVAYDVGEESPH